MAIDPGFDERYEAVMARWPVPYEGVDLESRFGTTHVNVCGPTDAPPVVLLPGGRSTSATWYATVGALAQDHRVYAVDTLGDRGRSVRSDEPLNTLDGVMQWLDAVWDGLGLETAAVAGHSMGAYYAMRYALHAPSRVWRLVLFDPTDCLSPTVLRYRLRAVPLLVGRHPGRYRSFNMWESRDRVDPVFLDLWAGAWGGSEAGVWPKRPSAAELATLTMPVLVFVALESRQNNPRALAAGAAKLPNATVVPVQGASHFMLPQGCPDQTNPPLAAFLAAPAH
jgi:pimeloyl-ACP methyl ester carboxylesterase